MLLVYTRRHNGDVLGDQERKGFSPLGTAPFSCKYFQKIVYCIEHQHGHLATWLHTKNKKA